MISISVSAYNNASLDIDDVIAIQHETGLTCNILANVVLDFGDRCMGNLDKTCFYQNRMTKTDYIRIPESMLIQGNDLINLLLSAVYPEMFSSKNVVGLDSSESD